MPALTKNQKIEALVKLVQKRCRGAGLTAPPPRTVLETLMYAALLENATFDKADLAYTVLENYYIDWNEIRVCTVRELADTLTDLPNPEAAAERVRKALQGIFEKTYTFNFEDMRKKGKALAEHVKTLESMAAGTPYMIQYVSQVALDGHLIPLDEASLRIMRRLGLSQTTNDGIKELCIGLDRVVLKKNGLTFAAQLHHFAAGFYDVPDSPELLSQLSAIDSEAVNRSWMSPVLVSHTPVGQPLAISVPSVKEDKPEPPLTVSKSQLAKELPKPKTPEAKPNAKSKPVAKPTKKPGNESVPVKKSPSKSSAKSSAQKPVKKPLPERKPPTKAVPKVTKTPSNKDVRQKNLAKPVPQKKKGTVKKKLAKSTKEQKTITPSQTLRKKKPK